MKIFRSFEEAKGIRNPVVTTGSFDGVHIGHKTMLNRLRFLAEKYNGESVLITFDPHPRKVLYPESAGKDLKLINSQEEKLLLLRKTGLDNLIIIRFTLEFSKITSEQFVRDFLYGKLNAKSIVVGFNHHFGFNKEGDYRQLWGWQEKYNFEAEEIPEQEVQHETVSSTKIRAAISEGYIQKANAYLDHYYIIIGKPEPCKKRVNVMLPSLLSIRITEECKLLPARGIYAVSVETGKLFSKGMAIISGSNTERPEVLLHVFNELVPGTDDNFIIRFHKKIHGEVSLEDDRSVSRINTSIDEISELIY
jgi:riboflavin kinase / FMN adenylyltransferase